MKVNDITRIIETAFPKNRALEWDNVGLLIGDENNEVQKILLALDATDDVIEQAVSLHADMLITHHPLIFKGIRQITEDDFIGRRILKLARHRISCYAMHTNFDVGAMGREAGERLGLKELSVLEVTGEAKEGVCGIGVKGTLMAELSLQELANKVKQSFDVENVHVFGKLTHTISRVAVVPGSGGSELDVALEAGADVLITGDIGHHEGMDAALRGLAVIDAGHFGLEHIFAEYMERFLNEHIANAVQTIRAEETAPYQVI